MASMHFTKGKAKHHQTGHFPNWKAKMYQAKDVGWRKSASGKWYYENRRNRSDV